MKRILFGLMLVSAAMGAKAQKSEIAEAGKAWNEYQKFVALKQQRALADDLKLLTDGLTHTDKAIVHEKTKNDEQAWSMRGLLASAISYIDTVDVKNAEEKAKIGEEALAKTIELDKKGEEKDNIAAMKDYLNIALQNRAIKAYNKQDYASALAGFEQMLAKNPNDTALYVNAGVTAKLLKKYPEAIAHYKKAISLNSKDSKSLYQELLSINLQELKDTAATMAVLDEALAKYPEDENFIGTQTDIYMQKGDTQKIKESLTKLLAKDPNKPVYNYLYGDLFFKEAQTIQEKRNKMPQKNVKEYNANYNKMSAEMTKLIDQAIPYYKKALDNDPKYIPALQALKIAYAFKGAPAKKDYDDIKAKLKALGEE